MWEVVLYIKKMEEQGKIWDGKKWIKHTTFLKRIMQKEKKRKNK